MGIFKQTKYLLRKNYLIKRRNLRTTLQEVLVPIWWIMLLFVIKLGVKTEELPAVSDSQIPTANISLLGSANFGPQGNSSRTIVGFVTNDIPNARLVIELMNNYTKAAVNYMEFNSTDDMLNHYRKYSESTGFGVGIEFAKGKNKGLAYTLRVNNKVIPNVENKLVGKSSSI